MRKAVVSGNAPEHHRPSGNGVSSGAAREMNGTGDQGPLPYETKPAPETDDDAAAGRNKWRRSMDTDAAMTPRIRRPIVDAGSERVEAVPKLTNHDAELANRIAKIHSVRMEEEEEEKEGERSSDNNLSDDQKMMNSRSKRNASQVKEVC